VGASFIVEGHWKFDGVVANGKTRVKMDITKAGTGLINDRRFWRSFAEKSAILRGILEAKGHLIAGIAVMPCRAFDDRSGQVTREFKEACGWD
jgi:hypothetical protein